jgi:hypothetical protein
MPETCSPWPARSISAMLPLEALAAQIVGGNISKHKPRLRSFWQGHGFGYTKVVGRASSVRLLQDMFHSFVFCKLL